jgi:hypothetical protein
MEVTKCLQRKGDGAKMVIVPKHSDIVKGDCVAIIKLNESEVKQYARNGRS